MNPMKTKLIVVSVLTVVLLAGTAGAGHVPRVTAQEVAYQTVTFTVEPIRSLTVSGDPNPLVVGAVDADGHIVPVNDSSTTYAITTNVATPQKITARLNENMPFGLTLRIQLQPPDGALAESWVALSEIDETVVSQIEPTMASHLPIHYTLEATIHANPMLYEARTVTLTLTDD